MIEFDFERQNYFEDLKTPLSTSTDQRSSSSETPKILIAIDTELESLGIDTRVFNQLH